MCDIPRDLYETIFEHLDGGDLAQVLCVNKAFAGCAISLLDEKRYRMFYALLWELLERYWNMVASPMPGNGIILRVDNEECYIYKHGWRGSGGGWVLRNGDTYATSDDLLDAIAMRGKTYEVIVTDSNLLLAYPWRIYQLSGPKMRAELDGLLELKRQEVWLKLVQQCDEFTDAAVMAQELQAAAACGVGGSVVNERIQRQIQGYVNIMHECEYNIIGLWNDYEWWHVPLFGDADPEAAEYMSQLADRQANIDTIHKEVIADWHANGPNDLDATSINIDLTSKSLHVTFKGRCSLWS